MTRPNTVTVVAVFAFFLAACASFMAYSFLKKQGGGHPKGIPVVAAATDIAIGTKLEPGQMKIVLWPKEAVATGYHPDLRGLPGRIAIRQISAGDVITETKLMPQNPSSLGGVMTYMVPQGHRAVTVSVNEVAGVAGFITPNSRVDVVLTTPRPGSADKEENISKIMLQNVPVLACGQVTEQKEGKPAVVPTVTLDLVPDDAEKLIVGSKKGSLQLLLRNVIDVASVDTTGSTIRKALGSGERPTVVAVKTVVKRERAPKVVAPVKQPSPAPPMFTVEIIKGGAKSSREFAEDKSL